MNHSTLHSYNASSGLLRRYTCSADDCLVAEGLLAGWFRRCILDVFVFATILKMCKDQFHEVRLDGFAIYSGFYSNIICLSNIDDHVRC